MINPRATVLLCQPDDFQRWVWHRILISQNLGAILVSSETDLPQILQGINQRGQELPHLILIDRKTSGFQPEEFCPWCVDHFPDLPVMLLESEQTEIPHHERQGAIAYGAVDILPAFEADNLALKGIAGIKKVLCTLGGLPIQNDSLVSCLLALKQDLETSQPFSIPAAQSSIASNTLDLPAVKPNSVPNSPTVLQPVRSPSNPTEDSPDKSRHKRVYRGRVY